MLLVAESPVFPVTAHNDLEINLGTYKPWCAATELSGLFVRVEGDEDTPLKHPEKSRPYFKKEQPILISIAVYFCFFIWSVTISAPL